MIHVSRPAKGFLLMLASGVAFCVMGAFIKLVPGIDSYKTTLFRFVIGLGILGTAALFGKIRLNFNNGPLLFTRGLFGGASVFLYFLSIAQLGMAKGTVISYAYPALASVISVLMLGERMSFSKAAALAAALAGIYLLATKPGEGLFTGFGIYEIMAVLGAVFSAVAVVTIKRLHETDSSYTIFFSQCCIGLWLVIIPANLVPCSIGYIGGALLVGIGLTAAIAQLLMTEGYRYVSVTVGSLLGMLVPVLSLLMGIVFFQEPISARALVGALIIIGACVIALLTDHR